ncbi:MAG: hypothetical protein H0U57_02910 [Tatlockia sp.]|nr:hypothetical protein [Tatlockia sp.]
MSGKGIEFWQKKWNDLEKKFSKITDPVEKNQKIIDKMFKHYYSECYFTTHGQIVANAYLKASNLLNRHTIYFSTKDFDKGQVQVRLYDREGGIGKKQMLDINSKAYEQVRVSIYSPVDTMLKRIKQRVFQDKIIHQDGDVHQILQVICQNTHLDINSFNFNIQSRPSLLDRFYTSCFACFFPPSKIEDNNKSEDNTPLIKRGTLV